MKLSQKAATKVTRAIVMGLSGTGKSTLTAKLAEQFNLLWFTLDNDSDILFKLPQSYQDNIELFDLPDSASFPVAADTLMKLFKEKSGTICHTHGVWKCPMCTKNGAEQSPINLNALDPKKDIVVLDTGSQLAHSIFAKATKDKPVDYKPERDDWGTLRKWTEFFYSEFQAAKFNLVVIFHAVEAEMEDGKIKLVPSFGSKDMSSKIAGAFSHVIYTEIKNKKHTAASSSLFSGTVLTKSRTDFAIESMGVPSLIPIFTGQIPETIQGEKALPETATINTPATAAAAGLSALRDKMAAATLAKQQEKKGATK